ncbi:hypothetical protein EON64_12140 [archaeon]|nr:MAG: hypothetical protein EON64_12140 [archaeon]
MLNSLEDMKDLGIDSAIDKFLSLVFDVPVASGQHTQVQHNVAMPTASQALPCVVVDRNADILLAWEEECELMEEMQHTRNLHTRQIQLTAFEQASTHVLHTETIVMEMEDVENIDISIESIPPQAIIAFEARNELGYTQVFRPIQLIYCCNFMLYCVSIGRQLCGR